MSETIGLSVAPPSRGGLEQVVVICAYCGRMRTELGGWEPQVRDLSPELVSHGCCPDCFEREMAKCRVRVAGLEWRARRW